jgi:hypothetical protein
MLFTLPRSERFGKIGIIGDLVLNLGRGRDEVASFSMPDGNVRAALESLAFLRTMELNTLVVAHGAMMIGSHTIRLHLTAMIEKLLQITDVAQTLWSQYRRVNAEFADAVFRSVDLNDIPSLGLDEKLNIVYSVIRDTQKSAGSSLHHATP